MNNASFTRREFIITSGKSIVTASLLGSMMSTGVMAKSKSVPMQPIRLDLKEPGNAGLLKVGGAQKIDNPLDKKRPIIVTKIAETAYAAFSSRCTHRGCEVSLPENNIIVCDCHNSNFDIQGKVTHGPAKKDLKAFSATLEGTILTIRE
jgi:Rieske Fe-S protein